MTRAPVTLESAPPSVIAMLGHAFGRLRVIGAMRCERDAIRADIERRRKTLADLEARL